MFRIESLKFYIKELNRERSIRVYLPNDYDENKDKRYGVLYMHDGHNLFFKETSTFGGIWNVQKSMSEFESEGNDGVIIVGIDCNNGEIKKEGRFDEYSPWINDELDKIIPSRGISKAGGEGEKYVDFIVKSLKPFIDKNYRTLSNRENTYIAGSSMGGFISLYAGYKYKEVFAGIGAFSTAIWFKKDKLIDYIRENFRVGTKVYLDIGTSETSDENNTDFNDIYLNDTNEIYSLFKELGQREDKIILVVDKGANHSEAAWEKRFPGFIRWMLCK